eukprot:9371204-Pyramimonas_sp.AAC.1
MTDCLGAHAVQRPWQPPARGCWSRRLAASGSNVLVRGRFSPPTSDSSTKNEAAQNRREALGYSRF